RAPRGAEEIGDEPEWRPGSGIRDAGSDDVREQQRGTTSGDHTAVDFRGFEMTIDRRLHRDDVVVTLEAIDECAEIREAVVHPSIFSLLGSCSGSVPGSMFFVRGSPC